jgi:hypothetical protein
MKHISQTETSTQRSQSYHSICPNWLWLVLIGMTLSLGIYCGYSIR